MVTQCLQKGVEISSSIQGLTNVGETISNVSYCFTKVTLAWCNQQRGWNSCHEVEINEKVFHVSIAIILNWVAPWDPNNIWMTDSMHQVIEFPCTRERVVLKILPESTHESIFIIIFWVRPMNFCHIAPIILTVLV